MAILKDFKYDRINYMMNNGERGGFDPSCRVYRTNYDRPA